MPLSFDQAAKAFRNSQIKELYKDPLGLRFLKLRSLSRRELMERLLSDSGEHLPDLTTSELFRHLFSSGITDQQIDATIRAIYREGREERRRGEDQLVSELYKIAVFDWGGLHQNSLEKTIVDNYVKRIRTFDTLSDKIENELHYSMRGYVLCSWYNHWTSMIIEDLCKDHPRVLPAVGLVKQIDFFIDNVPFDLKVTYLPEGYIRARRSRQGGRPELTLLKRQCRSFGIHFDQSLPEGKLLPDLWAKLRDHPSPQASAILSELHHERMETLQACIANPEDLIVWFYQNQGVRRFDASNRLFLVLVDCNDFFASWKLKRARPLLAQSISTHLDQLGDAPGIEVAFDWEGDPYSAVSDVIFVTHGGRA